MGKTWKKRENHGKHVGNWNGKGEEYGHNWRPNAYKGAYREFCEKDEDYPKMRRGAVPPEPWEDQQSGGRVRPDNSRFNHRSMKKEKEARRNFENNFPDLDINF